MKQIKQKKCKHCGMMFTPNMSLQQVCGIHCAIGLSNKRFIEREKKKERERKKQNANEKRELKEKLKTKGDWHAEAQKVFNTYIRNRDKLQPCISCGKLLHDKFDAGHYISVKQSNYLRYNSDNVFGQCVQCNQHLHGNLINYRIGLIERIGIERVQWLEDNRHKECKQSVEDLKLIIKHYKSNL